MGHSALERCLWHVGKRWLHLWVGNFELLSRSHCTSHQSVIGMKMAWLTCSLVEQHFSCWYGTSHSKQQGNGYVRAYHCVCYVFVVLCARWLCDIRIGEISMAWWGKGIHQMELWVPVCSATINIGEVRRLQHTRAGEVWPQWQHQEKGEETYTALNKMELQNLQVTCQS